MQGAFDDLHAVVFSRADDASQRLFYYVRELQQRGLLQGPRALVFDIALIPRESSLAHTARLRCATLAQAAGRRAGGAGRRHRARNVLRHKLQLAAAGRPGAG